MGRWCSRIAPVVTTPAPIVNATTRVKFGQRVLTQQVQGTNDNDLYEAEIFYTQPVGVTGVRASA
jgi:hypothetical protein